MLRAVGMAHYQLSSLGAAAQQAAFLRSVNYGVYVGTMVFGFHAVAFVQALLAIWKDACDRRARGLRTRSSILWFLFVGFLWTTALANETCHVVMNSNARIDYDMSQHSSFDYFISHQMSMVNTVSVASQIVVLVLTDVFLLVRCHCLWRSIWMTAPLGLVTLLILICLCNALVRGVFEPDLQAGGLWIMPFFSSWPVQVGSIGILHILYTCLLAFRVRWRRRDNAPQVLVTESAFIHGFVSVTFTSVYCAGALAANILLPSLTHLQAISVELIVVRVLETDGRSPSLKCPLRLLDDKGMAGPAAASSQYGGPHWHPSFRKLEDIYEDDEPALSETSV